MGDEAIAAIERAAIVKLTTRARRLVRPVLALLSVTSLLAASLLAGSPPARADSTTTLSSDVVHNLNLATLLGPVPADRPVTVGVVLHNPNEAGEDAYLQQLYDPSSASYQQFLDADQFNQQFGVPATTTQAAESWLASAGLTVAQVGGAMNYLQATGSSAQVAAAFGTPLNRYSAGARTFYANSLAPTVPASLPISAVFGLNDYGYFRVQPPHPQGTTSYTTASPPTTGSIPQTGSLSPKALWSIYDQPSSNLANGQTMAILGWGVTDPVVGDLRSFEQENDLPQVPLMINHYGATTTPDTNDGSTFEWELDTQASTAMAPNVLGETLYFAHHNTDADLIAALAAWVNDKGGPRQASASFGECENIPAAEPVVGVDGMEGPGDVLLKQAVIEGRTLFASSGDNGSSCTIFPANTNGLASQGYPALNYPSSSRWAVAVGGTILNSDGGNPPKRFSETAWEYGGGGNSTNEPAGAYQQGVAPTSCTTDQSGNPYPPGTAPSCRATPDVSAISGDVFTGNGMLITGDGGADQQGDGTSLSSPLWLGMWTRIQAAAKKKGLGYANFALYRAGKSGSYHNDFFDVTVGDNQFYPALPGWDNTTGWGTPDVAHLMVDLTGRLTPTNNVPPPVAASPVPQVSSGTLFSDPSVDDQYTVQGQTLGAQGTDPQLDILSGAMALTPDGKTLRTIITVRNLTTTIPTGGVENDYNFVWTFNGVQYFTQLAIEPGGLVQAYDGQVLHVSLETRYQQLHVDTASIVLGANGTIEVDVPLANVASPAAGQLLQRPSAQSYVREGALAGPLEPVDSDSPYADFLVP